MNELLVGVHQPSSLIRQIKVEVTRVEEIRIRETRPGEADSKLRAESTILPCRMHKITLT